MKETCLCRCCGHELNEKTRFCPQCGKELTKKEDDSIEEKICEEKNVNTGANDNEKKVDFNSMKDNFSKNVKQSAKNRKFSSNSFYILDLIKRLSNPKNIPIAIYIVLNFLLIGGIFTIPVSDSGNSELITKAFFNGLLLYLVSLMIALSPIGEFILRFQSGCKKNKTC